MEKRSFKWGILLLLAILAGIVAYVLNSRIGDTKAWSFAFEIAALFLSSVSGFMAALVYFYSDAFSPRMPDPPPRYLRGFCILVMTALILLSFVLFNQLDFIAKWPDDHQLIWKRIGWYILANLALSFFLICVTLKYSWIVVGENEVLSLEKKIFYPGTKMWLNPLFSYKFGELDGNQPISFGHTPFEDLIIGKHKIPCKINSTWLPDIEKAKEMGVQDVSLNEFYLRLEEAMPDLVEPIIKSQLEKLVEAKGESILDLLKRVNEYFVMVGLSALLKGSFPVRLINLSFLLRV